MNGTTWRVTTQYSDQSAILPDGQVIIGKRVHFLTGIGNRGVVLVPDDQYNPDTVAAMVNAEAVIMDTVSALTDASLAQGS